MPLDDDGFAIPSDLPRIPQVKAPPPQVNMPAFFDGVRDRDEAIARAVNKLTEPYSVEVHGRDEGHRRLADALALLLAIHGGLAP